MIAIVDYNTGNLCSVRNALQRIGADYILTADPEQIRLADHVILPGVGEAAHAMDELRKCGLHTFLPTLTQPVLGICIGIQLMCRASEEGNATCMGIFDADVRKLQAKKVPEMGWNQLQSCQSPLLKGISEGEYVYYVHSYAPTLCGQTIATTEYGETLFSAALQRDNFFGTQFHPEKSGATGERILSNFLSI